MAWIHKEDSWRAARIERDEWNVAFFGWKVIDGIPSYGSMNESEYKEISADLTFTEWLDLQCSDDWEVLKISRAFNSSSGETWVVFRKQV